MPGQRRKRWPDIKPTLGQSLAVASDEILEITVCKSSAAKNAAPCSRSCVSSGTSHHLTNAGVSRASGSDDGPDYKPTLGQHLEVASD